MGAPFPPPTGEFSQHRANCHCGAVRWAFSISPPLSQYPVVRCNCSVCQRNGYLLVYPTRENVRLEKGDGGGEEEGKEKEGGSGAIGSYSFGKGMVSHKFCRRCGSSVFFEVEAPPQEVVVAAEAEGRTVPCVVGMNVRMITGLDIDKLVIKDVDGRSREPQYTV